MSGISLLNAEWEAMNVIPFVWGIGVCLLILVGICEGTPCGGVAVNVIPVVYGILVCVGQHAM